MITSDDTWLTDTNTGKIFLNIAIFSQSSVCSAQSLKLLSSCFTDNTSTQIHLSNEKSPASERRNEAEQMKNVSYSFQLNIFQI